MDVQDIKLQVPEKFRRGSLRKQEVKSLLSAQRLLKWVDGHKPLAGARILDFGCGVKVTQALYQQDSPQALYVGLDLYAEMIEFLRGALADDDRYAFHTVPFRNDMYKPEGEEMRPTSDLPLGDARFDILLMFSVVTHLVPTDTAAVLAILRKYAAPDANLLFWAFADPDQAEDFKDDDPARPLLRAKYRSGYLEGLIADAGWTITGTEQIDRAHRKIRYICAPAA